MNALVNLAAKATGLWRRLDGLKTYLVAAVAVLTGALGLLQDLLPILEAHDTAALLAFAKGLPQHPSWLIVIGALGGAALRDGMGKPPKT